MTAAMIAAVLAGLAMAALLALFSINYLVNQVVLGWCSTCWPSGSPASS